MSCSQACVQSDSRLPVFSVSDHWLFSEDCSVQRFCSSPDGVMVCGNADGREVYAVTHDIVPDKGWVMQFKVNRRELGLAHGVFVWPADVAPASRSQWAAACRSATPTTRCTSSTRWTLG